MSSEAFDDDALRSQLHQLGGSVGAHLDLHPYSETINLAAMRPEIERRQTTLGRIGYYAMRVAQYFRN